jgi:hypothetical protein
MNSATSRFWGRGHNDAVEREQHALVIGSGYTGVKHAEALDEPLATFEDGLRHARFAAAALESASREKWVNVA